MNTSVREYGRKDTGTEAPEKVYEKVTKSLTEIREAIDKAAQKADAEIKKTGDMAVETKKHVDELLAKATEAGARLLELEQKMEKVEKAGPEKPAAQKSIGHQLIEDEKFKGSEFSSSRVSPGKSVTVDIKATPMLTGNVTQGDMGVMNPELLSGILTQPKQRLFIRDLIMPGTTGANAVAYVRQTGFTNNARVVSEGAQKPYSEIAFDVKMAMVATIAHLFKASRQILDDFRGLQSTVDAELRYGLKYAEEQQILFGDGTGNNMHGIVPQASAFAPAFEPEFRNKIDDLRLAMLQAQLARLPATAIVLHPTDWAEIELTKTQDGAYVFASPLRLAGPTLWGLPIVSTEALDVGDFLVGAFRDGAQLFDREQMNIVVATQNEDDFVKNLITIRCEERLALAVKRPEAFIYGPFNAAVSSSSSSS